MRAGFPVAPRRLGRLALAAALLLAPLAGAPRHEPPAASHYAAVAVKAAYLVNFIRFTDWPETALPPDAPILVGVSGDRALEDELIRFADRQTVLGRRLRIHRLRNTKDLEGLHLAFFKSDAPPGEHLVWREALAPLHHRPVLTVSDHADFTSAGGMIRLYLENNALRFEIAPDAARASGLLLSSRLLALARIRRAEPVPSAPAP
jgi:hypothetical protein